MRSKFIIGLSETLLLIGLLSFVPLFFIAGESLGNGMYVANIYEGFTPIFWGLYVFIGFCGIARVLLDIFLIGDGYRWLWGTFLLVGLTAFFLSFPFFQDYAFHGQYDNVIHYSYTLEIYEYGRPYIDDFYPVTHIWASILASLAGMSAQESVLVFPIFMYFMGVSNAFLFAWMISDRPEVRGLIVTMSVLPVFTFYQSMFYPLQIAIFYLWFFAAIFMRTRSETSNLKNAILLVLVLILLPFIHPLGVIAALIFILSYFFLELFSSILKKQFNRMSFFSSLDKIIAPFAIIFVSWFTWFSSFNVFGVTLNRIYQSLFNELSGQSFAMRYTSVIDRSNRDIIEILRLTVFVHGPALIFGILLLIATFGYVIKKAIERDTNLDTSSFLVLGIVFFYGMATLSLVVDVIASFPHRYYNYAIAFVPVFIAPCFFYIYHHSKRIGRVFTFVILIIAITGAFGTGTFNLFFSEIVRSSNHQFSSAQLHGYQFLMDFTSGSSGYIYSPIRQTREVFALGPFSDQIKMLQTTPRWRVNNAPEHFGFLGEPDSFGRRFYNPEYLIVTAYDIGMHSVGPQQARFSPDDFTLLEFDGRWHKVYDSGDLTLRVWREE